MKYPRFDGFGLKPDSYEATIIPRNIFLRTTQPSTPLAGEKWEGTISMEISDYESSLESKDEFIVSVVEEHAEGEDKYYEEMLRSPVHYFLIPPTYQTTEESNKESLTLYVGMNGNDQYSTLGWISPPCKTIYTTVDHSYNTSITEEGGVVTITKTGHAGILDIGIISVSGVTYPEEIQYVEIPDMSLNVYVVQFNAGEDSEHTVVSQAQNKLVKKIDTHPIFLTSNQQATAEFSYITFLLDTTEGSILNKPLFLTLILRQSFSQKYHY